MMLIKKIHYKASKQKIKTGGAAHLLQAFWLIIQIRAPENKVKP